ncbi:MAG TPA: inositol monophosphatase [Patescibacteria group bacterium]|nr:inositol monophosphatase [Patescibacteria group bacterium]
MEYAAFLEESLLQVSQIAVKQFGKISGVVKRDDSNQVLTDTDLEIGKLLVDKIRKAYPSHNIIDEETGVVDNSSEYTWVVDPIDGTSNFAMGVPMYGIMIGLLEGDTPVAGGLSLPSFSEIYVAEKGRGAFCNGKPIWVCEEKKLINALVSYGIDGHQENSEMTYEECKLLARIVLGVRNLRSSNSAYDFALVAKGKYAAYLNQTSKIWDNVAPQIIIEEAGGVYRDFSGKTLDYSRPLTKANENFMYIAASPSVYDQLFRLIQAR